MKKILALAALLLVGASPRIGHAQIGMASVIQGMPLSYETCRSRVRQALTAEGYGNQRELGNGLLGFTSTHAASVVCIRGASETIVVVTASCQCDPTAARDRLLVGVRDGVGTPRPTVEQTPGTEWTTAATQYRGQNGRRYAFDCPAGGTLSSRIWGANPYTDDSSVCTAGVHAGVISVARGGRVVIEIEGPRQGYPASLANGVQTGTWGAWSGSYRVVTGPS